MMVFISKVNNYMFRPKAAIFRLSQLQFCSKSIIYMSILHSDIEISTSLCNIDIYMTIFEQNCNCDNLKMAALGRNMQLFTFLINTIIQHKLQFCFLTEINSPLVFQHTKVLHAGHVHPSVRPSVWDLLSQLMLLDRFSLNLTLETSIKSSEDLIFNYTHHNKAKCVCS